MRYSLLAAALAVAVGSTSFAASATDKQELAELKAALAELQAKVIELEERTDAQSDVNLDAAAQLDKLNNNSTKVDTRGGIKVTSADGNFEANLGGRIHFDTYIFDRDIVDVTGGNEFRRARLTLSGKVPMGWEYRLEQDFAAGTNLDGLRDAFLAKSALGGKFYIGHFKPYRSMEELTSSNEILMMERPFSSATGLFNGRQFQQGVGYQRNGENYTAAFTTFSTRAAPTARNEGIGWSSRVTYAPINNDNNTLHFGGWASSEDLNKGSSSATASASYAGRRGPSQVIASTTAASGAKVTAYGLEAAGSFGPLFFQGEYVNATFGAPLGRDQDVNSWYLQGSWIVNGGHKAYKPATAIFASPKYVNKGIWEMTARYDTIKNTDVVDREANSLILGVNYYINANVRFMFNYTQGESKVNGDETGQYAARMQLGW